jgi:hypothetical protein
METPCRQAWVLGTMGGRKSPTRIEGVGEEVGRNDETKDNLGFVS